MKPNPHSTLLKLLSERYPHAKAAFWGGSVARETANDGSDLDIVIIYESLPHAYREAFVYNGWPIDAFVNDVETLNYFFEQSRQGNGISGLMQMINTGIALMPDHALTNTVKALAQKLKAEGPARWDQDRINHERFLITDILEDIKHPNTRGEMLLSAAHLIDPLMQFYLRANHQWSASGKALLRTLTAINPTLAQEAITSFDHLIQTGDAAALEQVAYNMLAPFGGFLWDGYRSNAHAEWKLRYAKE